MWCVSSEAVPYHVITAASLDMAMVIWSVVAMVCGVQCYICPDFFGTVTGLSYSPVCYIVTYAAK